MNIADEAGFLAGVYRVLSGLKALEINPMDRPCSPQGVRGRTPWGEHLLKEFVRYAEGESYGVHLDIIIGFVAGLIAKFLMPGKNEPSGSFPGATAGRSCCCRGHASPLVLLHNKMSLRLGARIFDLKEEGWNFRTEELPNKNTVYYVGERRMQRWELVANF
jgi:hypothetical protein